MVRRFSLPDSIPHEARTIPGSSAPGKMHVDETLLSQKYELVKLSVNNGTQLSNRTAAVIARLESASTHGKPVMVVLTAKARVANKLISVVEIAKRELNAEGVKCFQYNALTSEMIEIERNPKKTTNGDGPNVVQPDAESDSEDAFETMEARESTIMKKRLVPIMTTYLCNTPVKELKNAYG